MPSLYSGRCGHRWLQLDCRSLNLAMRARPLCTGLHANILRCRPHLNILTQRTAHQNVCRPWQEKHRLTMVRTWLSRANAPFERASQGGRAELVVPIVRLTLRPTRLLHALYDGCEQARSFDPCNRALQNNALEAVFEQLILLEASCVKLCVILLRVIFEIKRSSIFCARPC